MTVVDAGADAVLESGDGRGFSLRLPHAGGLRAGDFLRVEAEGLSVLCFVEQVTPLPGGDDLASGSFVAGGGTSAGSVPVTARRAGDAEVAGVLAVSGERLQIGVLARRPEVPVCLNATKLNRHTFWCGQSGSGKTYALGVALERILTATRLPLVILDPNSDFVGLATARADAPLERAQALRSRDIRVLRPDDPASPLRVRFVDLSIRGKAAVLRLDPVVDRAEYNTLLRLRSDLARGEAADVVGYLRSLADPGAEALAERVENLGVHEWTTTWAAGAVAATDIIAGRPAATVLDLGGYERQEEQLAVALAVLEHLWAHRTERRPVLLVIDEAHNLCPPDPTSPLGVAVRDRLVQIAAEGRKFGIWLLVSTQRPGKVHPGVVSQCDNLTLMRMNSVGDLAELERFFGFVPAALVRQSLRFVQGEALMAGGFVPLPGIVRVGPRITVESGIDVAVPMED